MERKWCALVWLPSGLVVRNEAQQLTKNELDERNAKQAAQGIINLRWKEVEQDADGNWVRV